MDAHGGERGGEGKGKGGEGTGSVEKERCSIYTGVGGGPTGEHARKGKQRRKDTCGDDGDEPNRCRPEEEQRQRRGTTSDPVERPRD